MTRELRLLSRTRERPFTRFQLDYEVTIAALAFDLLSYRFVVFLTEFYCLFDHWPHNEFVCLVFKFIMNFMRFFLWSYFERAGVDTPNRQIPQVTLQLVRMTSKLVDIYKRQDSGKLMTRFYPSSETKR